MHPLRAALGRLLDARDRLMVFGKSDSGQVAAKHVSIVCRRCGDSSPYRCKLRGCPQAAANLMLVEAWLRRRSA